MLDDIAEDLKTHLQVVPLDTILHVRTSHLKRLDNLVLELRVLTQRACAHLLLALSLVIAPDLVSDPRRIHRVIVLSQLRIAVEVEIGKMLVFGQLFENVRVFSALTRFITIKYFPHVLLTARMVLVRGPIGVELMTDLSIFLLLVGLLNEWVLKELRPGEALAGRLVEQALQEGFKLGGHVVRELDRVLHDQVDQRVDAICVEGWRAHEQLVYDDS